jgi:hypothetical protein
LTRPLASFALLALPCAAVLAQGGGDAPGAAQDPEIEITGVYAFIGTRYDDPGAQVLNVLVQVRSFAQSGSGIVYPRFADDATYAIHVTDPVTAEPLLEYELQFSAAAPTTALKDPTSILSYGKGSELGPILVVGDTRQNYVQTFAVRRRTGGSGPGKLLAGGLLVPPPNLGPRTTPAYNDQVTGKAISGATQLAELDPYTATTLHDLPDGEAVFAGTRDEAFYADLPGIYDLLHPRVLSGNGQAGGGADAFKGATALSYAIQIPLALLPSRPYVDWLGNAASGIGVYAATRVRQSLTESTLESVSPRRPASRMGNPLLCQMLLPLRHKDGFQHSWPAGDGALASVLEEPELAQLFNQLAGTNFVEQGRGDIVSLYLPDVLRVDTTTGPVQLAGQTGFSRLSVFGGDLTAGHPGGWPNGRRPGDDVVDILFTILASGPAFAAIDLRGDNVSANDQVYNQVFPYLATPHSATNP